MAQIIKHRRGSITQLKDVTARISELVVATGSIGDLNGPFLFVGETEGVAGAYRPISKIYQGAAAPTITVGSHGSVIDGTPFYASGNKSLYILSKDGNTRLDFTGNIEGNTISGVTINNLTGTTAYIANASGSFTGSGQGLYNIPASGITGLELNRISEGTATASISQANGLRVNTKTEITGALIVTDNITGSNLYLSGDANIDGNINLAGNITIGNQTTDIIQFGGEVSSSILPIIHNSFDLGSPSKNWRNLHVSGTAYVDTLQARQVNFSDLGILQDLSVSGNTYLGNGGDITVVSGALYNDQLTQGRIVHVGTNGQLVDNENFTYDLANGFLMNTSGSININTSGSLNIRTEDEDDILISSSYTIDIEAANDVNIVAADDVRITAKDVFSLRNEGINDPITLVTKYNSGDDKTLSFDQNGNLTIPNGFTGSYLDINTQAQLASAAVEDLTDNRIVIAGVGGELEDDANFTFDGTKFIVGQGTFEVDIDGDVRTSGSLRAEGDIYTDNVIGISNSTNTLHLNGGNLGAPDVELTSNGNISLFSEGGNINMTGSVRMGNELSVTGSVVFGNTLNVSGSTLFDNNVSLVGGDTLFVNHISDYGAGNLDITTSGNIVLESTSSLSIQLKTDNAEDGTNYLNVNSSSVNFSTYDITSGLTHRVLLDNTGSLRFENVDLGITGSLGINGSLDVTNDAVVHGNLYVSGNLELLGTASYVNISSSQVDLGTNIINLNTYAPFERFGGITVHDSGSNAGATGSLLWDAVHNVWLYSNPSGSAYASARFIAGPKNTGSLGDETGLTIGHFPIATGDDHISDSLLTYLGTTLSFNTNKFTVDSTTGDASISGNFTLSYSGGTDNGTKTSRIMFRNSSNVVGFVPTTETTDVLDGLLGYKNSTGALAFSTVIDGGTY